MFEVWTELTAVLGTTWKIQSVRTVNVSSGHVKRVKLGTKIEL